MGSLTRAAWRTDNVMFAQMAEPDAYHECYTNGSTVRYVDWLARCGKRYIKVHGLSRILQTSSYIRMSNHSGLLSSRLSIHNCIISPFLRTNHIFISSALHTNPYHRILFHSEYSAESALSRVHVLDSLAGLFKRELLDHTIDVLVLGKRNGLFAVESVTRRPSVDRSALHDHGDGIDWDLADSWETSV